MATATLPQTTVIAPFRTETNLQRIQNRGHINRHGHSLTGFYIADKDNPNSLKLIRVCCGESVNPEEDK